MSVDDVQAHWKIMGFKWQVTTSYLLRRMAYGIQWAQHRQNESPLDVRVPTLHVDPYLNRSLLDLAKPIYDIDEVDSLGPELYQYLKTKS